MKETLQLSAYDTVLGADAVEVCVVGSAEFKPNQAIACATYSLNENGTRDGRLLLLDVSVDKNMVCLDQVDVPGILDIRWISLHDNADPLLLCACADGSMRSFGLNGLKQRFKPNWVFDSEPRNDTEKSPLCLSLDVRKSTMVSPACCPNLCASFSDGSVAALTYRPDQSLPVKIASRGNHSQECWVAGLNINQPFLVYSGGDDGKFCGWDVRQAADSSPASFVLKSAHDSVGVTSIACDERYPDWIFTGGYDDTLRIWDHRMLCDGQNRRANLHSLNLGGGVWRLRFHPEKRTSILAACMYDGAKIVSLEDSLPKTEITYHYTNHKSIVYGISWLNHDVLSASFYDHSLQLWQCLDGCDF